MLYFLQLFNTKKNPPKKQVCYGYLYLFYFVTILKQKMNDLFIMADTETNNVDPQVLQLRELRKVFRSAHMLAKRLGHKGGVPDRPYCEISIGRFANGTYSLPECLRPRIIELYNLYIK